MSKERVVPPYAGRLGENAIRLPALHCCLVAGLVLAFFVSAPGSLTMRTFLRENSLSLFFFAIFVVALRPVVRRPAGLQRGAGQHGEGDLWGAYVSSPSSAARSWRTGSRSSSSSPSSSWPRSGSSRRARTSRRGSQTPGSRASEQQRIGYAADQSSPLWARVGGMAHGDLLELASHRDGGDLLRSLVRTVGHRLDASSTSCRPSTASCGLVDGVLARPDFWERTLQNWQSEFLAVGTMAGFTIYLRQRGSPESKPVGAPHDETASSGYSGADRLWPEPGSDLPFDLQDQPCDHQGRDRRFHPSAGDRGCGCARKPKKEGMAAAVGALVTCPYCIGLWVSAGLSYSFVFFPRETRFATTSLQGRPRNHRLPERSLCALARRPVTTSLPEQPSDQGDV